MNDDWNLEERVTLKCYDHLKHLSDLMLDAARDGQWDDVGTLESKAQRVVDELKLLSVAGLQSVPFKQEKMRIIRTILVIDAEIRDLANPRLRQLESAMRAPQTARRLSAAYGCSRLD